MSRPTDRIVAALEAARDDEAAASMRRYMRDQFPFLGVPTPARRRLLRDVVGGDPPDHDELLATVRDLWERPEREFQYVGVDVLGARVKILEVDDLAFVRELVVTKSWWDTVDALAISVVGPIVLADRPTGSPVMDEWMTSDDLWVARTAVLHQNHWKTATDADRLFAYCVHNASNPDFFMRKAIGWALRQYARTDPAAVQRFVEGSGDLLAPLSRREALKHLGT